MKKYYVVITLIILIAAAAIGSNMYLSRGPVHDTQASTDINTISSDISNYTDASGNSVMPSSLNIVQIPSSDVPTSRLSDYTFQKVNNGAYKICTTFMTSVANDPSGQDTSIQGSPDPAIHPQGYYCFSFTDTSVEGQSDPIYNTSSQ